MKTREEMARQYVERKSLRLKDKIVIKGQPCSLCEKPFVAHGKFNKTCGQCKKSAVAKYEIN